MSAPPLAEVRHEVRDSVSAEWGPAESERRAGSWRLTPFDAVTVVILGVALAARLAAASGTYLNADEALHFQIIDHRSLLAVYRASLTNAHPPLFYVVGYVWHFLGRSEFMMRIPSVLAGTGFCWVVSRWIRTAFGDTAGMIGLIVAAFCPALVAISAELRHYSLMLVCAAGALYFLERAFQEASISRIWCFSVCLYLAILTHYSAVFFAGAVGVYALLRIADGHWPRKLAVAWIAGQAGALAICGLLYVTHISKLSNQIALWGEPFEAAEFHGQLADFADFVRTRTTDVFLYLFQQPAVAHLALFLFVGSVAFLLLRGLLRPATGSTSLHLALFMLLPFMFICGAAAAGAYPYVGSRHTIFLAPFVIAAVSSLLATIVQQRLRVAVPVL